MNSDNRAFLPSEPLILIIKGQDHGVPIPKATIALRIPPTPPSYVTSSGTILSLSPLDSATTIDEWEPLLAVPHDEYLGVTDKLQSLIHTAADLDGLQRRLDNILVDLGQDL